MPKQLPRRAFLSMTALSAVTPLLPRAVRAALAAAPSGSALFKLRPFDLNSVRLRPGEALEALEVNRRYLMGLDPARLLHTFRLNAGLPSTAEPLGGWEAPNNELRGHFTGHYLSACALLAAQTGDATVRERGVLMAMELAKC